jgi:acylpyruvate hydrolase
MASAHLSRFVDFGRKIICVGRNYRYLYINYSKFNEVITVEYLYFSEHAIELGNAIPERPLLFLKPTSSYVEEGSPIKIPAGCSSLHHEIELGVVIKSKCSKVKPEDVMIHVGGFCLALDMTARDFQDEAKKKGHPWTLAKGFDTSCPVSAFIPSEKIMDPHNIELWCSVNGVARQRGSTKDMIFNVPTLLSYISTYFTLEPGDVVLTGTPSLLVNSKQQ